MEDTERMPLLPGSRSRVANCSLTKLSLLIFALGSLALGAGAAITLSIMKADPDHRNTTTTTTTTTKRPVLESISFSVFSLMVWGSPGSFGVEDKERRMAALGEFIAADTEHDVFLLNDLWMRPDHATIRKLIPKEYQMTTVNNLSSVACDGIAAPEFCSGLAIISKHRLVEVEFMGFTDHGDLFWDYEYFLRRGAARVRLEPSPGQSVDVVLTSLASLDYNTWYRTRQMSDLIRFLSHSKADHLIVAGDFNVDPRDSEDTYKTITSTLTDAFEEFYKKDPSKFTDPAFSTLGNPGNTYTDKTQGPIIYDYIFYKNKGITLNDYKVLNLKSRKEEISLSDHQALSAKFTLS